MAVSKDELLDRRDKAWGLFAEVTDLNSVCIGDLPLGPLVQARISVAFSGARNLHLTGQKQRKQQLRRLQL